MTSISKGQRSVYTASLQNEAKSRIYAHECILSFGWKFRNSDQDNDIDGEIEIFDPIDNAGTDMQTSAKFIKIQIKSTDNCDVKNGTISYICPIKFLHFCDVCDVPIILILYDISKNTAYWLWVQHYIYSTLNNGNASWRFNKETATIKFKTNNPLDKTPICQDKLRNIAYTGVNVIAQMRKANTASKYFTIYKQEDNSTGIAKRASVKVLIEKSFASSKDAIRELIPKINEYVLSHDYLRSDRAKNIHNNKPYDIISLLLYDDIMQIDHGVYFCRTQWINKYYRGATPGFSANEIYKDICIEWSDLSEQILRILINNEISKGEYFRISDQAFKEISYFLNMITLSFEGYKVGTSSFEDFKSQILSIKGNLDKLHFSITQIGFPPHECKEINKKLIELVSYLGNIGIIVRDNSRDEKNVVNLVNSYLKDIDESLPNYLYERRKIV